jgi:hypothetical protein
MTAPLAENGAPPPVVDVPFRRAPPADLHTRQRVYGSPQAKNPTSSDCVDKIPHAQTAEGVQSHVHCVEVPNEEPASERSSAPAR